MKDVAARAGVHPSTVSLSLNRHPRISDATRERVLKAARELGYTANPYIDALMRNRRKRLETPTGAPLAFLTFFPTRSGWRSFHPRMGVFFEKATEAAAARGFRLEEYWAADPKISPARLGEILYTRNVRGVLLGAFPKPQASLALPWEYFSAVAFGYSFHEARIHRVRINFFGAMDRIIRECVQLGYRRIGVAVTEETDRRLKHRPLGAYLVHRHAGTIDPHIQPLVTREWTREVFLDWLDREKPEVVVEILSRQTREWIESSGRKIPGDIGLVSLSCPTLGGTQSGIYENWEMQGARAAEMLADLVAANDPGLHDFPRVSIIDGVWNPGKTVRQLRKVKTAKRKQN